MILLGVILLIVGLLVASLHVLFTIGIVLLLVGLVLNFAGGGVGGRRWY